MFGKGEPDVEIYSFNGSHQYMKKYLGGGGCRVYECLSLLKSITCFGFLDQQISICLDQILT